MLNKDSLLVAHPNERIEMRQIKAEALPTNPTFTLLIFIHVKYLLKARADLCQPPLLNTVILNNLCYNLLAYNFATSAADMVVL